MRSKEGVAGRTSRTGLKYRELGARLCDARCMASRKVIAIGIDLYLRTTSEGGRAGWLAGGASGYRPDWRLQEMAEREVAGIAALHLPRGQVELGDSVRAVILSISPRSFLRWLGVREGDELSMMEGARVCGDATVLWIARGSGAWPDARYLAWIESTDPDAAP